MANLAHLVKTDRHADGCEQVVCESSNLFVGVEADPTECPPTYQAVAQSSSTFLLNRRGQPIRLGGGAYTRLLTKHQLFRLISVHFDTTTAIHRKARPSIRHPNGTEDGLFAKA